MQRTAVSIVSNIAEGTSRASDKEKERFIKNSLWLIIGNLLLTPNCKRFELHYIRKIKRNTITINKTENKLSALKRSYAQRSNTH